MESEQRCVDAELGRLPLHELEAEREKMLQNSASFPASRTERDEEEAPADRRPRRSVTFAPNVVTEVWRIPLTDPEDVGALFYRRDEIQRFREEEEERLARAMFCPQLTDVLSLDALRQLREDGMLSRTAMKTALESGRREMLRPEFFEDVPNYLWPRQGLRTGIKLILVGSAMCCYLWLLRQELLDVWAGTNSADISPLA